MPIIYQTPRRFGVELEGFVERRTYGDDDNVYGCRTIDGINWDVESDGSLRGSGHAVECTPPPLSSTEPIYSFYGWLKEKGWFVNDSAGLHIHVEVDDYEPHDFQKLLALMVAVEPYIYSVTDGNRFHNGYCKPLSRYGDYVIDRLDRTNVERMYHIKFTDDDRYLGFNLEAYGEYRKTVEFRYFAAQEEAEKVTEYVELVTKLVDFAKHATYDQILVIALKLSGIAEYEQYETVVREVLQLQSKLEQENSFSFENYNRSDLNATAIGNVGLLHGFNMTAAV